MTSGLRLHMTLRSPIETECRYNVLEDDQPIGTVWFVQHSKSVAEEKGLPLWRARFLNKHEQGVMIHSDTIPKLCEIIRFLRKGDIPKPGHWK